ncbi:hypothetical protein [Oceanicoccus sp.]|uniref:hypothetical protein n=1 Tax=Oceanicoccus sp. TaxID=2691044 RepID=UPI0026339F92|nr:hypothetical protein [Oceanicoccus sp.]
MAFVTAAIIGSAVVGAGSSYFAGQAQSRAARRAADAQREGAEASLEEQRRQFDAVQELFQPYVQAGTGSLAEQMRLIGLGGEEAQQEAITAIQAGPEYQELIRTGEQAILQNAAATGGLRGGNVQRSLAQFRPQVLSSLINQQYQRLGGISQLGQASAAGQAAQGSAISGGIAQTQADLGAAMGQSYLAQGQATANMWGNIAGAAGQAAGMYAGYNAFGGSQQPISSDAAKEAAYMASRGAPIEYGIPTTRPFGT